MSPHSTEGAETGPGPLCVDLDGTLTTVDLLVESVVRP